MKVNILDAHDRYLHFIKQSFDISECCQDMVNKKPFGDHPFYIFAHARTLGIDERYKQWISGRYKQLEDVPDKTLIWQPRLTKPEAQTNSMLFKAYPGTDVIRIIWMIPDPNMWAQYEKGKVTESNVVFESINQFKTNKSALEQREPDDLPDDIISAIYKDISLGIKPKKTLPAS